MNPRLLQHPESHILLIRGRKRKVPQNKRQAGAVNVPILTLSVHSCQPQWNTTVLLRDPCDPPQPLPMAERHPNTSAVMHHGCHCQSIIPEKQQDITKSSSSLSPCLSHCEDRGLHSHLKHLGQVMSMCHFMHHEKVGSVGHLRYLKIVDSMSPQVP